MKTTFFLLAGAGIAAAQSLTDLPPCGQTCVSNMIRIASSNFGCTAGDATCYCSNRDFGYGIRDCSIQSCPPGDAAKVIEFGTKYCASVFSGSAVSSIAVPTGSATGSGAGVSSTGTGSPSAITTVPLVAVSTGSGTTFITTTGFSTIYGPLNGAATSAIGSATSAIGSVSSNIAASASSNLASASSGLASASSNAASVVSSASGALNSASSTLGAILSSASNAVASSTRTGAAPIQTAAPLLMGAGLIAMLAL